MKKILTIIFYIFLFLLYVFFCVTAWAIFEWWSLLLILGVPLFLSLGIWLDKSFSTDEKKILP